MLIDSIPPVEDLIVNEKFYSMTKSLLGLLLSMFVPRKIQNFEVTVQISYMFQHTRNYHAIHERLWLLAMLGTEVDELYLSLVRRRTHKLECISHQPRTEDKHDWCQILKSNVVWASSQLLPRPAQGNPQQAISFPRLQQFVYTQLFSKTKVLLPQDTALVSHWCTKLIHRLQLRCQQITFTINKYLLTHLNTRQNQAITSGTPGQALDIISMCKAKLKCQPVCQEHLAAKAVRIQDQPMAKKKLCHSRGKATPLTSTSRIISSQESLTSH